MRIKRGIEKRFACVGKIKIGEGPVKGRNYPKKLDHFEITTMMKDKNDKFILDSEVHDIIGKEPKSVDIYFHFDDPELNLTTCFEYYSGKSLICQGDGIDATRHSESAEKSIKCDRKTCEFAISGDCKYSAILRCGVNAVPKLGGVYEFRTHGQISTSHLQNSIDEIATQTNNIMRGIPFRLDMLTVHHKKYGKIYVVNVVCVLNDLKGMRKLAIEELTERKQLGMDIKLLEESARADGVLDMHDDPEDVADEFYHKKPSIETLALDILVPAIEEEVMPKEPYTETFDEMKARKKAEAMKGKE